MVAKINSGSSLYGALAYNQTKVDNGQAKVLFTSRMIEPAGGVYDIGVCMHSFEPYLLANQKTEKPVLHVSINPDPKDKLSNEQLSEIAQDYMEKVGYGDQPFIVYKHEDIGRTHIHIVSLRVDETGRKIKDSFEHRRSMDACRQLEQKYGLIPADKKQRQEGLPLQPVQYEDGDVKHQVAGVIRPLAASYHFQSLKQYNALLSFYNINVEEVRGEVRGKPYRGLVYFALNSKGEKIGSPFRASLFGKSVGIDALEKRMEKSAEIIKAKGLKERIRKVVASAIRSHPNRRSFETKLAGSGISVLLRENDQGRIYGVTFIDHKGKSVFNGSQLGKEFSANAFNDLFGKKHQENVPRPDLQHDTERLDNSTKDDSSDTHSVLGLLSLENHGIDPEEEAFARRMRKKRKRPRHK